MRRRRGYVIRFGIFSFSFLRFIFKFLVIFKFLSIYRYSIICDFLLMSLFYLNKVNYFIEMYLICLEDRFKCLFIYCVMIYI